MNDTQDTHLEVNPTTGKLNWLRAAVLGANDGIVSVAALIVGVASAISDSHSILITGAAGLLAGALSMSLGEYVSVSTQRDTEEAFIEKEKGELRDYPEEEFQELASYYGQKGLSSATALQVAKELTAHDALAAHIEMESKIDPEDLTNPWHAAFASAIAFSVGGIIPLLAMILSPSSIRVAATFGAVLIALIITGVVSARTSNANIFKATARVVFGGMLAMAITTSIGKLFGTAGF